MKPENGARWLQGFVHRADAYIRGVFPLGITARLAISFIAVAALAAAANLIAQESVSVILWSKRPAAAASPTLDLLRMQNAPVSAAIEKKQVEVLVSAVDRFGLATQLRAETNSAASEAEYAATLNALDALRRTSTDFLADGRAKIKFDHAVAEYLELGRQIVLFADQRRAARVEHSTLLESINVRLQTTLDGAWKIFGRVIARQSLIQLRIELDAVRQHSERIVLGEEIDANDLEALTASENTFMATFANNATRLASGEGADWIQRTRADFDQLIALRVSLADLNFRYSDAIRRFSRNHVSLFAAINSTPSAAPALPARREIRQSFPPQPLSSPSQWTPGDLLTETVRRSDQHTRDLMAVFTVAVLLIVTGISVLTVRSVVRPVRRILNGATLLAAGNAQVQVAGGGIRELDTLACAFNDMASRIAAAQAASRLHEETLEHTVLERTHRLQTLALQDPLTSLPNRRHLSALLTNAIERAAREQRCLGVYFLDIDNFKNFNDSLGHVFGDRVLMSVANRLEEISDGLGFVARLGGDEFTIVYENAHSEDAVHETGLRLVQAFQQLLSVDDRDLSVSVSVGASIFPQHGRDAAELLRAADSALFRAKELGRSRLAVFTPELIESAAARFAIEQGLRRALEREEFELRYQPEIDLATMEVKLVEALIRWRMPDGRLASPGEFLAVAEQSGLIAEISEWVLRTAVQAAAQWHHGGWPGARVAINISPRQFLDPRFVESLTQLLQEFALPAQAIELELTETVMQTGPATIAALRLLQSRGFGIALDDFGTGYSSLTSLEQLPLSRIKLDRSLIASIDSSQRSAAIARAIMDLCEGLGLAVTAEGVERPTQLARLLVHRSIYLQGYLLSDAVPFAEVLQRRSMMIPKLQSLLLSVERVGRLTADTRAKTSIGGSSVIPIQRVVKS
jgi:diguanylate cyclase (GGDEF)-like protein